MPISTVSKENDANELNVLYFHLYINLNDSHMTEKIACVSIENQTVSKRANQILSQIKT